MPSHLSTIGFEVSTPDDLAALAERVVPHTQAIRAPGGRYLRWAGDGGEELWLQVDRRGEIIGITPHFSGKSSVRVGLQGRVEQKHHTALNGAFQGWADPDDHESGRGAYPFVFDVPDAAAYDSLVLPCVVDAQIAAFAHDIAVYDSAEAYDAAQAEKAIRYASRSFFPGGMLSLAADAFGADAAAIFTGSVVEAASRTNSLTGQGFYWALVDTFGGTYDVVFDRSFGLPVPAAGAVLSGAFWLSGRLTSWPRRTRSWVSKIVGRRK
jgi:hypothetical protein